MSAGRPKSETTLELEDLFKLHVNEFVRNEKVLPPSDEIWCILRDEHKTQKKPKTIYTAALKWYQSIRAVPEKQNDSGEIIEKNTSFETSMETSDATLNESTTSNDRSLKKVGKKIRIQISPKAWRTIAPQPNVSKRKQAYESISSLRLVYGQIFLHKKYRSTMTFRAAGFSKEINAICLEQSILISKQNAIHAKLFSPVR